MDTKVNIPATILQVTRDKAYEIEGKVGKSANLLVRAGGVVVKIKADNSKTEFLDECEKNIDQDVDIQCVIKAGQGLALVLTAVSLA